MKITELTSEWSVSHLERLENFNDPVAIFSDDGKFVAEK